MVLNKNLFILNIINDNFLIKFKNRKNYILINTKKIFKSIFNNKKKTKNDSFFIIDFKKFNLIKIFINLFLINKNFLIYKNFFIFFDLKKEYQLYNFFPDWPGEYQDSNFYRNLIKWIKRFLFIFINLKKIKFLLIKLK